MSHPSAGILGAGRLLGPVYFHQDAANGKLGRRGAGPCFIPLHPWVNVNLKPWRSWGHRVERRCGDLRSSIQAQRKCEPARRLSGGVSGERSRRSHLGPTKATSSRLRAPVPRAVDRRDPGATRGERPHRPSALLSQPVPRGRSPGRPSRWSLARRENRLCPESA